MFLFFIVSSGKKLPSSLSCSEGNYLIRDRAGNIYCVPYPDCPPGLKPKEKCDVTMLNPDTISSECEFCKMGYFKEADG